MTDNQIALLADLWGAVEKEGECWVWTRGLSNNYPVWTVDGQQYKLHRFVYEMVTGEDITTKVICHTCDNPRCVRPSHLFAGTHNDNVQDKVAKGRARGGSNKGLNHPSHVLNEDKVIDIRLRAANGETIAAIARWYDVSEGAIRHIVKGRTWRHL